MKFIQLTLLASVAAAPLPAQETRALDAHMHGVTEVQIAVDGSAVEILLHAPGVDIVGFEHEATSDDDTAALASAIVQLGEAGSVVTLDPDAGCTLEFAEADLHGEAHEEGAESDARAEDEVHEDEGGHSEFEAHYSYDCASPEALTTIDFPFFEAFPNAQKIEAQFVTASGAGAREVTRGSPQLTLN